MTILGHSLPDTSHAPFADDFAKDVQVVVRPNAKTVVIVFCGAAHNIGISLDDAHRFFSRLDASVIYLRDMKNRNFLSGVNSLGADTAATVAQLQTLVRAIGAQRIVCFGGSAGVFGALLYGLALQADAALCLGGATNLTPEFNEYSEYLPQAMRLRGELPEAGLDIREHLIGAAAPLAVRFVYANDNWDDRRHAEHLAGLASITLQPIAGVKNHNVIERLLETGEFDGLLHQLAR